MAGSGRSSTGTMQRTLQCCGHFGLGSARAEPVPDADRSQPSLLNTSAGGGYHHLDRLSMWIDHHGEPARDVLCASRLWRNHALRIRLRLCCNVRLSRLNQPTSSAASSTAWLSMSAPQSAQPWDVVNTPSRAVPGDASSLKGAPSWSRLLSAAMNSRADGASLVRVCQPHRRFSLSRGSSCGCGSKLTVRGAGGVALAAALRRIPLAPRFQQQSRDPQP
jgi:hypothetical protein